MRLSKEKTKELIEAVRRELVKKPDATIFDIQQSLNAQYNHVFDKNFLGKLKNKIHKERYQRYNKMIVQYEIAKFEDTVEVLCSSLWEIIDDEKSTTRERINAIREIRSAKVVLLETMFNSGIFETSPSRSDKGELSPEDRELVAQALNYAWNADKPVREPNISKNYENMV